MPTYYDSQNQPHVLTKRLGSGGEGTVYSCDENPHIVAKIYHEPITTEKAGKLRWMASRQDESLNKVAAWVLDVLHDAPDGNVVGFLMPNIRAKEIHELYSLKSRRIYFPEATWHFLIHTAANLARAFYNLHKNGHVMGDINHGNCVVLADGTVKLIDCDSYSIKTERKRYSCEVGVTTHLAPELQGVNLRNIERQANHDNFGLAVIIFQLLFLGRHPFAGNFLGGDDKPIEDCIRETLFAYGKDARRKMVAQPPGTLSLSSLSPELENLFERAFTQIHNRPTPREWIEALEDLSNSLEQCSLNPGHLFYEKNLICPWCEIESQTGLMLFPFVTTNSHLKDKHKKSFDIVTIENLIESFDIKPNLPVKLTENVALAPLSPEPKIVKHRNSERTEKIFVCTTYFFLLFLIEIVTMNNGCSGCGIILSVVVTCILYNVYKNKDKSFRTEETDRLDKLEYKWSSLENEWTKVAAAPELEQRMIEIREKLNIYRALQSADSSDPAQSSATAEIEKQDEANAETCRDLEQEIITLLAAVRAQSVKLRGQRQNLLTQSKKIVHELSQTRSNVKILHGSVPIGVFLIAITIGTPVLTFSISEMIEKRTKKAQLTGSGYTNVNSVPKPPAPQTVIIPDASISDTEIASFPPDMRLKIINELIRQAGANIGMQKYKAAEEQLNFASRFDNKNAAILGAFGTLYYEQKKFDKALTFLDSSKELLEDSDTNFLIGMTYLSLKKYSAAKDVFRKLTLDKPTNEAYYNLGAAYQGLSDYSAAVKAYESAIALKNYDPDSLYQLGISLNKLGKKDEVRKYYQVLKQQDEARARQFKKVIGKPIDLDVVPENYVETAPEPPPPPKVRGSY